MVQIKAINLGKAYKSYNTRWSRLLEWILPTKKMQHSLTWVLRDINFTVETGDSIGIVGVNGAGKSTLLKLIVGTSKPTTGEVKISGRVSSLLELGMGFHPDFSGRQNVVMAAQIMGFNAKEIDAALPYVEEFAEIGEYIDQPIRVYSSGMQVRLAFSIATVRRPDVLIVDEALSVGDTFFQHKSFERIRKFRKQGTTLLIVSHDKSAIQSLCDRAILLDRGRVAKEGAPEEVMDFYNALIAEKKNSTVKQEVQKNGKVKTTSGSGEARVEEVGLYDKQGQKIECASVGQSVDLKVTVKVYKDIETLVLGYGIKDRLGQVMYGTNTWHTKQVVYNPNAGDLYQFTVSFPANFGVGSYSIQTALTDRDTHLTRNYEWRDLAVVFNIVNTDKTVFVGNQWNEPVIKVNKL